jgi:hypothetical protein
MILPLPFGTLVIVFGKPIEVPKGLSHDEYEVIRQEVEYNILTAQALAENKVKELKYGKADISVEAIPTETPSTRR